MTFIEPGLTAAESTPTARGGWPGLLRACVLVLVAMTVLQMLLGRFLGPSLIVLDILVVTGLVLLRHRTRTGVGVIAGACLLNLLVHSGLLVYMLSSPESGPVFAATSLNALASLTGLIAAVPAWRTRRVARAGGRARSVLLAAGVLAGVSVVASTALWLTRDQDTARAGDILLVTDGTRVDRAALEAPAGEISVLLRNDDLFSPRAFDIDALDVHLTVPPSTTRRVTFSAQPGRYAFHDEITFTPATGGSLTVH
ncbi:cupredoxin domain-containing protein [Planotetraspora kaengkrachanensis]|uniref:EfeO-type cupredoxin-like domain-containing protein n=1 Tax=Planotetraspora kaengkrachanensis TaxID=575193 RepID=A0A8J3PZ41_9ACTN|nr:cupredoxin domain-containing protein [Planotetraspora kaengkrachanensis]GIG83708.1 hypothetical protein Pka01_68350 [Planotetraspora kaengkrachanensis]